MLDNIGAEGDRSPDLDSLDFSSLLDMFENSDLTFNQMKHKVEICESKEFEEKLHIMYKIFEKFLVGIGRVRESIIKFYFFQV